MKMNAKTVIGPVSYEVSVDGELDKKNLGMLIVLSNPRKICNACEDEGYANKYLTSNKDQEGNVYINVKCKCGARSKLGSYKTGGFFWHDYEVYQSKTTETKKEEPPAPVKEEHDEDVPF